MTRRLVEIDDETLAAARGALGTNTIKDTIDTALRQVIEARRARQSAALAGLAAFDWPADPDAERREMWRME